MNSRKRGCEIVTSARPAKCARAIGAASTGAGGSPTASTFVTGCVMASSRSGTSSARAPMNAE